MLQFFLKWTTYRTFKNGLLVDFFFKKIGHYLSTILFYKFTIFFADKYLLESIFSLFTKVSTSVTMEIQNLKRFSALQIFKGILHIIAYISLIIFLIFI